MKRRRHRGVKRSGSRKHSRGWIGVDLDGTLAAFTKWNGGAIGEPVPAMLARVQGWLAMGREVRVFTARVAATGKRKATGEIDSQEFADAQTVLIQDWTQRHLGVRLPVTAVKDFAMAELWDDRAVRVEKNTGLVVGNQA